MLKKRTVVAISAALLALSSCAAVEGEATTGDDALTAYYQQFPYQDTYNYALKYTGGDAAKLNTWVLGTEPVLVKAGEDKLVRMNNDTYYKMAFLMLDQGPVILRSTQPSKDRFSSYQLMG